MTARVLAGPPVQRLLLREVETGARRLERERGRPPHLTAVLVGEDPASQVYVRMKTRKCDAVGISSRTLHLEADATTETLLERIATLNADEGVDGILVQLPLPDGIDTQAVLDAVDPAKDVDGLHPENAGLLLQGRPRVKPCTPAGILAILDHYDIDIEGRHAVVIGRSEIVGKPTALLLLHRNATVTMCHSRTPDLAGAARAADILVVAVGRPGLVDRDFVRPGATVVDVGTNRVADPSRIRELLGDGADWDRLDERGYLLVGDVHPEVADVAGALTPSPGGVGPLTIAMLLANTLDAARRRHAADAGGR